MSHLNVTTLEFERVYGEPPTQGKNSYKYYQIYKLCNQHFDGTANWRKVNILAKWEGIPIPRLNSVTKPHSIWFSVSKDQLEQLLIDEHCSILGKRNLVQPFQKHVKWNPTDGAFHYIKIQIQPSIQNQWLLDGELFAYQSGFHSKH